MFRRNFKIRKVAIVLLVALFISVATFVGCKLSKDTIVIGVSKYVSHQALDSIEDGLQDGMTEAGYENIIFDFQNANGDISKANVIAQKFKADRVDLAIGIATPTSQSLAHELTETPVVFSAVTDPIEADLVETFDHGLRNVTGVSDMTPVKAQIALLQEITEIQSLGLVYDSEDTLAVRYANMVQEGCNDLGIEFIDSAVTDSTEVKQAAQSISSDIDGFYVSKDDTILSAHSDLVDEALNAGIPIMSIDIASAEGLDVMLAWETDYYKIGKATASMADKILKGASPADLPIGIMTDPSDNTLRINLDTAQTLGITISDEIIAQAAILVEDGKETKQ